MLFLVFVLVVYVLMYSIFSVKFKQLNGPGLQLKSPLGLNLAQLTLLLEFPSLKSASEMPTGFKMSHQHEPMKK